MKRVAAATLDLSVTILAGVILCVLLGGGGIYSVGGLRVSLRTVDNPVLILSVLLLLRYRARDWAPFLGVPQWRVSDVVTRSGRVCHYVHRWASALPERRAARMVVALAAAAFALKTYFAWVDPGFFSGDDVEIHEMTLGALLHQPWAVWDLRNATFPFLFIYPVQRLASWLGATDAAHLVFAGRFVVALVSSAAVWLTWKAASELWPRAPGYAVIAAGLLATNKLHIAFGSSELPRPIATVLVILAFLLVGRGSLRSTALGGIALGAATSFRFSECVFAVPAVLDLWRRRQWRHGVVLAAVMSSTALVIIGLADAWYWREPFHSVEAMIHFTLAERQSSRGFQPPWWYVTHLGEWTNPAVAILAGLGARHAPRAALWAVVPLLLLSALPHKEARYVIPVFPFVALLAARGVSHVQRLLVSSPRPWLPPLLVGGVLLGAVHDAGHYRLPRTNQDVTFARELFRRGWRPTAVAIEQAWRVGGGLYTRGVPVTDLDPVRLREPGYLSASVPSGAWVLLDRRTASFTDAEQVLQALGYAKTATAEDSRYVLWKP